MVQTVEKLKGALVISCQAAPGDPLENTDALRRMALAALAGGGEGLRLNSPECIAAVRSSTRVPIIGIKKVEVKGVTRITADFQSARELATAGADIIAIDCTNRPWPEGEPWRELVGRIHSELGLPVMADISTTEEAMEAAAAGADLIGTTLNGYTRETRGSSGFNWELLSSLVRSIRQPVVAEGRIATPAEARRAIDSGAWCVVIGSAITRPGTIAAGFARALQPHSPLDRVVAVDIGGTSVKAGLVDREGTIHRHTRVPTCAREGRDSIAASMTQAVEQVLLSADGDAIRPLGLGIASAGVIDVRKGSVFAATENLPGWTGFDLRSFAEKRFGLPTAVENDGHAAALGEMHFGAGRHLSSFVVITIGTGIGGGIILDRKLLRGQHGFAGAIGHTAIRSAGRPCTCGKEGCLEAYVSAAALEMEYSIRRNGHSPEVHTPAAREIAGLAATGDPVALAAYSSMAEYLAEALVRLFNLFDPEAAIVSGGLVDGHPGFMREVEDRLTGLLHFGNLRKPHILSARAGYQAGLLGAAAAAFESHEHR